MMIMMLMVRWWRVSQIELQRLSTRKLCLKITNRLPQDFEESPNKINFLLLFQTRFIEDAMVDLLRCSFLPSLMHTKLVFLFSKLFQKLSLKTALMYALLEILFENEIVYIFLGFTYLCFERFFLTAQLPEEGTDRSWTGCLLRRLSASMLVLQLSWRGRFIIRHKPHWYAMA